MERATKGSACGDRRTVPAVAARAFRKRFAHWVRALRPRGQYEAPWGESGSIEERTKTSAGWRVIAAPPNVMALLSRRIDDPEIASDVALFSSPMGRVRNKSNTTGDLRRAFDRAGFGWVTSHTFRKTVATRQMLQVSLLGRLPTTWVTARPSMTLDVYVGRRVASSAAAEILARPE